MSLGQIEVFGTSTATPSLGGGYDTPGGTSEGLGDDDGGAGAGGSGTGVEGTSEADPGPYQAFSSRERQCGATLTIDGVEIVGLTGEVVITESLDNPVKTVDVSVTDERLPRFVEGSLSNGHKPMTVTLHAGPSGGIESWLAFSGRSRPKPNTGDILMRGGFSGESYAADYLGKIGCLRANPLQGYRRGYLLGLLFASAGVPLVPNIDNLGRVVRRPVDLQIGPLEQAMRWGEMEGLWNRWNDENQAFEFISDRYVFQGAPLMHFSNPGNTYSMEDAPPSNPATKFVFSGARLTEESINPDSQQTTRRYEDSGIDANGLPWLTETIVTSERGAPLLTVTTRYETYQLPGVTLGPLDYQIRGRTTDEITYERAAPLWNEVGQGRITQQIRTRVMRTYDMSAIDWYQGHAGGHVWTTGGTYDRAQAELILVQEVRWDNTWNTDENSQIASCTLKSQRVTTSQYYSPLLPESLGGYTYGDGKLHADAEYTWREVEQKDEVWWDSRFAAAIQPEVRVVRNTSMWVPNAIEAVTGQPTEEYRVALYETERWTGNASQTEGEHVRTRQANGISVSFQETGANPNKGLALGPPLVERFVGPVPGPPTASPDVPLFQQQPWQITISLDTDYTEAMTAELLEGAEDEAEGLIVARRRFILAHCSFVPIRHPHVPFLRPGDPILVTCARRGMTARRAFIWSIETRQRVGTSGKGEQLTLAAVLPDAPVWEEAA